MARPEATKLLYYPHSGNNRQKELFETIWNIQQQLDCSVDYCRRSNGSITLCFIHFVANSYTMHFLTTSNPTIEECRNFLKNQQLNT